MTDDDRPRRRPTAGRRPSRRQDTERDDTERDDTERDDTERDDTEDRAAEDEPDGAGSEAESRDEFEDEAGEPEGEPAPRDGARRTRSARRPRRADPGPKRTPSKPGPSPRRGNRALLPAAAARRAAEQIVVLTGRELEGVVSVERDRDEGGWRIGIEVVETRRIPDSADILAMFEVCVDEHGDLAEFRRLGRYSRGRVQQGGGR
ncbi:hypothetical protein PSU4_23640 [Pseudonocardia sulfidoxydans NBRC 16205]|uniref:Gas vesicle protein n=1 Tax=Pseudonocardia sulfidoxydans NBRC 16205 TaxID=1223511 RepID=A0A511DF46_9PSEU|nr:gas vesicle protein GvpO [Pseudonocardia sulfidoxydans]GEL23410.1 hypothetical protein PSU4_23640 [Pseudonocardia sulfidoxydans NBRC 16205]